MSSRVLVAAVALLVVSLAGCGPGADDTVELDPDGTDHTFVVSSMELPTNGASATTLGLDIDDKANDGIDNQFGTLVASLGTLAPGLTVQASFDRAIDRGTILTLLNLKTIDLVNAPGAGLFFFDGTDATPAPCLDGNDQVCRRHLDGSGSFAIDAASPLDAKVVGNVIAGTLSAGPGNLTLEVVLLGDVPVHLPLQRAKAQVVVTSSGLGTGSKVGGAISQADLDGNVIPELALSAQTSFAETCTVGSANAGCDCIGGQQGDQMRTLFDADDNCMISDAEVQELFDGILTADVDLSGDGVNDAVSIGIGLTAVAGTFTVPPL